jgi:hypothetical protein
LRLSRDGFNEGGGFCIVLSRKLHGGREAFFDLRMTLFQ